MGACGGSHQELWAAIAVSPRGADLVIL